MPTDRPKPQPQEEGAGAPAWMVTFADMMTLLLSFSQVDATKYRLSIGSVKGTLGTTRDSKLTTVPS